MLLCLGSFLNMLKVLGQGSWGDYSVYYHSAVAALHNNNPYLLKGTFVDGYIYPPISLVFFYPLALMPIMVAGKIWAIFSFVCLLVALWLLLKQYNATDNRLLLGIVGILVFNFFPAKFTLGMGQVNNVILLLIVLAMYLNKRGRDGFAGALFGTALTLKYAPLFILPYLLIRRKWRAIIATCITIIIFFILGFLVLLPETSIYYFQHVVLALGLSSSWTAYYNQALSGFLIRDFSWLTNSQLTITRYVMSLIMLAISLYVVLKRKLQSKSNPDLEIGVFITLNLLLNTFSEQHHFVLLLIPLLVTFFVLKQNKLKWHYYILLAFCYILTAINMKTPSDFPILLQSHVFYGAFMLWIFDLYLLWKPTLKLNLNK